MVLGSLFFHRDSAARRLWRGEAEPEREFTGFPMRTALLVPPPIACTMWWYSARYKVVVLTPDGWGITHTSDGESCGWIALGGFAVLGLAIWWDGYVARQVRRRRAAGAAADADALLAPAAAPPAHDPACCARLPGGLCVSVHASRASVSRPSLRSL